ncbi:MAG: helix-turn-helix domain-containing protein [Bdellovibrionales bacterium]
MTDQPLSAAQIRAAMSLLLWENRDLAKLCDVSTQTISNIKRGATRAQPRVLEAIRKALETAGVEFFDQTGVRMKQDGVDIFHGKEGFKKLFMLILSQVEQYGGKVYVSGVDERQFVKHQAEFADVYMKRMVQLVKKRKDIQFKILVCEGDTYFAASKYATYRWQSKESYNPNPIYVFADYLALISFQGENAPKVILIRSPAFADAYRKLFLSQWRLSKVPQA